jgi:hypothetical protein
MKRFFIFILSVFIFSCDKNDFKWNLPTIDRLATISTLKVDNISNNDARVSCEIKFDANLPILDRGVCLGINVNPTITNLKFSSTSISNLFSISISGLSQNTTYYVRAFVRNKAGIAYGNQLVFTTSNLINSIPELTTIGISGITINAALSGGIITTDGGMPVIQRGVCWSLVQNPTISDFITNDGTGIGSYSSSLSGLSPNTTYYIRAYATNAVGTAYGNQLSFTTSSPSASIPVLTTSSISNILTNSAVSGGNITSDGGLTVTQRGVCWSTFNQNPTTSDNTTMNGTGIGPFASSLSSLSPNTTYFVRAYAKNAVGTAYGNQLSFTTPQLTAALIGSDNCSTLNGITSLYYGMNSTSSVWGTASTGYNGNCWIAPNPNMSGNLGTVVGSNHYVQFTRSFINQGYIEFWINTYNPGYNNLIPVIVVNGVTIGNATVVGGQTSSLYWMKVRSPIIAAGNNTIKIIISGSYYVLKIDEIDFYEY